MKRIRKRSPKRGKLRVILPERLHATNRRQAFSESRKVGMIRSKIGKLLVFNHSNPNGLKIVLAKGTDTGSFNMVMNMDFDRKAKWNFKAMAGSFNDPDGERILVQVKKAMADFGLKDLGVKAASVELPHISTVIRFCKNLGIDWIKVANMTYSPYESRFSG